MHLRFARAVACALALAALAPTLHAQRAGEQPVTLNFVNAEIEAVARTMAAITGRNIVVDPRVKGAITLSTDRPVTPQQAFNQFTATLRLSGFTVVESGGLLKVVPEADAKLQGGAVNTGTPGGGGQIVTQIFRLNYENANNLVPILRPLISPNNTINVNPGNNSLVITDYADNLQRMARIIAALDVSNTTDVEIVNLRHALASDLAPIVQRLVDASSTSGGAAAVPGQPVVAVGGGDVARTTVIAEPRSNSLIIRAANPARHALVRTLIERLDQPGAGGDRGNIHVVYLKNADATRLAAVLRAALASLPSTSSTTGGVVAGGGAVAAAVPAAGISAGGNAATAPVQGAAAPSTGGQIQADPATNSLIITAPEPQYRQIRAVIDRLDARRAQVFIESLIAEVNANKLSEFGIQWQGPINSGGTNVGLLGTNFSVGGANIVSLALAAAGVGTSTTLPSTGVNLGIAHRVGGVYVLGFLARFLQSNGDGNILSTPNLLTLDNEEAKIVIGQNVPFVTGQYTNANTGTGGSVNPFQTIERKDVGLTLRVRPQISENGTVKLQIFQEVSSVDPASVNSAQGLITNKRSIESAVLVEDGGVVVLGGLLQDEYSNTQEKVPGAGDVPLLGNLFRSESKTRKKTNLMVFLRPVVLRDAAQTDELSLDRYELMRGKQDAAQPAATGNLRLDEGPLLPPVTRPRTAPGTTTAPSPTAPVAPVTAPSSR
ncbi:type II secretion system secretin GspD [Ramlibacter albus]|uniref:Type II secretion system secretin GspD n=1 Tax=Ramlibacter albus TaxID=2079448 RepID=A0A923S259_9BURK|nr:type II secretion system secretin GspD [Ramlibacter albus]MBC5765020.1 type II secretion system secretin GspD [Ramlibacter albus]